MIQKKPRSNSGKKRIFRFLKLLFIALILIPLGAILPDLISGPLEEVLVQVLGPWYSMVIVVIGGLALAVAVYVYIYQNTDTSSDSENTDMSPPQIFTKSAHEHDSSALKIPPDPPLVASEGTLLWEQLQTFCIDITHKRMATVRGKYNPQLYLQREKARQSFEHFLESDKRCFVLIGKAGVGKSNFIISLGDELQQSRDDICILMYDGANLRDFSKSLTGLITNDFNERIIGFVPNPSELASPPQHIQHIWATIARVKGIEQRKVILYVDAINENPCARELLYQLDQLVQSSWSWLRVVFSSRPEIWYTIKRGIKLAEDLYYLEDGKVGFEMGAFSHSTRIEPFSSEELPVVYAKHQEVFHLKTSYHNLSVMLRNILQDPLNLWLVARTYEGKSIPSVLRRTELVEQYLNMLLKERHLLRDDMRFLEEDLVSRLIGEGSYSNIVVANDIDIEDERLIRLMDHEILVYQESGRETRITFKYERFYEYFVGDALCKELKIVQNVERAYLDWITQLDKTPFLWGAIRNCLVQYCDGDCERKDK